MKKFHIIAFILYAGILFVLIYSGIRFLDYSQETIDEAETQLIAHRIFSEELAGFLYMNDIKIHVTQNFGEKSLTINVEFPKGEETFHFDERYNKIFENVDYSFFLLKRSLNRRAGFLAENEW